MNESNTSQPSSSDATSPEPASEGSDSSPDPLQPSESPQQLQLVIQREAADCDPPTDNWLEPLVKKTLIAAGITEGALGINIVHDDRMADLHYQFMSIPGTTDVLTFDMRDQESDPFEGDIIICIDEAARQAAKRNFDTRLEVLLYAVHGIMHLLGYDDHDPEEYKIMHQREDQILTEIGIGTVFHVDPVNDE